MRRKLQGSSLNFKLKPVGECKVLKILKSLQSKKSFGHDGISSEVLKLGADVLAVPLTFIINISIQTGKFPTNWKISKVKPLHKKENKTSMKNYRPIALLPVAGMVLEKIVALQIEEFFEDNKLFGAFQFGFQKHKNTTTELLTVCDKLLEAKEMKKEILIVLYDLSAAFDTVCHDLLLAKLKLYGFDRVAMKWMKSFLEGRPQMVSVSGKMSSAQPMNLGTPQGSRMSPLLFLCLMANMDLWAEDTGCTNIKCLK